LPGEHCRVIALSGGELGEGQRDMFLPPASAACAM
jgi:hypothetical protein